MTHIKFKNGTSNERHPFLPSLVDNFLFNDFMNTDLVSRDVFKSVPAVNISETAEKFVVELAAPGMNKEDFKIEIEKRVLKISAEKKEERKEEGTKFTRKEFSYTAFSRTFTMPEQVNSDAITAGYDKGVLTLQLPKKEEVKEKPVREISVS